LSKEPYATYVEPFFIRVQKKMTNEYRAAICQLKHQNEIFLKMGAETNTVNQGEDEVISDHPEM